MKPSRRGRTFNRSMALEIVGLSTDRSFSAKLGGKSDGIFLPPNAAM
jgi:hypothetical protein